MTPGPISIPDLLAQLEAEQVPNVDRWMHPSSVPTWVEYMGEAA